MNFKMPEGLFDWETLFSGFDDDVTRTRDFFQIRAGENPNFAAIVFDDSIALKNDADLLTASRRTPSILARKSCVS